MTNTQRFTRLTVLLSTLLYLVGCASVHHPKETPDCTVDMVLKIGEECKGPDYTLFNEKGELLRDGTYFVGKDIAIIGGRKIENGLVIIPRDSFTSGEIKLVRLEDKSWRIMNLPALHQDQQP